MSFLTTNIDKQPDCLKGAVYAASLAMQSEVIMEGMLLRCVRANWIQSLLKSRGLSIRVRFCRETLALIALKQNCFRSLEIPPKQYTRAKHEFWFIQIGCGKRRKSSFACALTWIWKLLLPNDGLFEETSGCVQRNYQSYCVRSILRQPCLTSLPCTSLYYALTSHCRIWGVQNMSMFFHNHRFQPDCQMLMNTSPSSEHLRSKDLKRNYGTLRAGKFATSADQRLDYEHQC